MSQPASYPPQFPQPGYGSAPVFPPPGSAPATWNEPRPTADMNPYASPQIGGGYMPLPQQSGMQGLWREGNLLVMHKMAPLPPICVKSGQQATQWLKRKLAWHPAWIFVLILLHILIYAVVALIMQKKATIQIGLTDEWIGRRQTRMLIAWGMGLGGIALGVLGIVLGNQGREWEGFFFLALPGFLLMPLGAAIYGLLACRLVSPYRITDQYVWLKGVHPSLLDQLPVWPYGIV